MEQWQHWMTLGNQAYASQQLGKDGWLDMVAAGWQADFGLENFDENRPVTKGELAVLLEKTFNPFYLKVDIQGQLIK